MYQMTFHIIQQFLICTQQQNTNQDLKTSFYAQNRLNLIKYRPLSFVPSGITIIVTMKDYFALETFKQCTRTFNHKFMNLLLSKSH